MSRCQGCERDDCSDCYKRKCPNCDYINPYSDEQRYYECTNCGLPHTGGSFGHFILQDGKKESKIKTLEAWIKKDEEKIKTSQQRIQDAKEIIKIHTDRHIPHCEKELKNLRWQLEQLNKEK